MKFNISRLHTQSGIVQLSGELEKTASGIALHYRCVSLMGTDGWFSLDLTNEHTQQFLCDIEQEVIAHLGD
ncbi:hypothetical protein [Motilimonas eburnea]|uniref:hypothetical protein n=1 Tax=Motilimonas eburnea TaxID=1737488 RepID=UPI001E505AD1|nr:hypothetical protein [Motilimonas eburnea]MCE2573753.1 hypothetical protein [Motilimonas eburnea]